MYGSTRNIKNWFLRNSSLVEVRFLGVQTLQLIAIQIFLTIVNTRRSKIVNIIFVKNLHSPIVKLYFSIYQVSDKRLA